MNRNLLYFIIFYDGWHSIYEKNEFLHVESIKSYSFLRQLHFLTLDDGKNFHVLSFLTELWLFEIMHKFYWFALILWSSIWFYIILLNTFCVHSSYLLTYLFITEINISSSRLESTATATVKNPRNASEIEVDDNNPEEITTPKMETVPDSETTTNVISNTEVGATINTRDTTPLHIPSSPTRSRQSLLHDHHYEASPQSLRIQLALARKTIKKQKDECRSYKQQIKRLSTKIRFLKDIVQT